MADNTPERAPALVGELQCRCRNRPGCPKIQLFDDGTALVTDEEQGAKPVRFTRDHLPELEKMLAHLGA